MSSSIVLPTFRMTADQREMLTVGLLSVRTDFLHKKCQTSMYVYERRNRATDELYTVVNVQLHNDNAIKAEGEIGEAVYDVMLWHHKRCHAA